jgi:hypothetical protein
LRYWARRRGRSVGSRCGGFFSSAADTVRRLQTSWRSAALSVRCGSGSSAPAGATYAVAGVTCPARGPSVRLVRPCPCRAAGARAALGVSGSSQIQYLSGAYSSCHTCSNNRQESGAAAGRVGDRCCHREGMRTHPDGDNAPARLGRCCRPVVRRVELDWYRGQHKKLRIFSLTAQWYTPGLPSVDLRFVLVCISGTLGIR